MATTDPFLKYLVWRAKGKAPAHAFNMGPLRRTTSAVCLYAPSFEGTEQVSSDYRRCGHCERYIRGFGDLMAAITPDRHSGGTLDPADEKVLDWFGEGET